MVGWCPNEPKYFSLDYAEFRLDGIKGGNLRGFMFKLLNIILKPIALSLSFWVNHWFNSLKLFFYNFVAQIHSLSVGN